MKEKPEPSGEPAAADLHPGALLRTLDNFQVLLTRPLTRQRLERWVAKEGAGGHYLVAPYVWGHIQWPKALGRPLAPVMASAFEIDFTAWQIFGGDTDTDLRPPVYLPMLKQPPTKVDGPVDASHYRVTFMADVEGANAFVIRVGFAPHMRWSTAGPFRVALPLAIDPAGFYYDKSRTREEPPKVLEPFNVVVKSFF